LKGGMKSTAGLSVRERPRTSTTGAFCEKGAWKIRCPGSPARNRALGRSPLGTYFAAGAASA
jgi:hypothetical protein